LPAELPGAPDPRRRHAPAESAEAFLVLDGEFERSGEDQAWEEGSGAIVFLPGGKRARPLLCRGACVAPRPWLFAGEQVRGELTWLGTTEAGLSSGGRFG
jgi:hypothetical protein